MRNFFQKSSKTRSVHKQQPYSAVDKYDEDEKTRAPFVIDSKVDDNISDRSSWKRGLLDRDRFQGWRATLSFASLAALVVLIANVSIIGWASTIAKTLHGDAVLFEGDCTRVKAIGAVWHVLINILSTLLLGASNAAFQILNSLTRKEVDVAHKQSWVDVGIISRRNWRFLPFKRKTLATLLTISSIPLHLLYNSVIYPSEGTYNLLGMVTTEDFVSGATFEPPQAGIRLRDGGTYTNYNVIRTIQDKAHASALERFEAHQCFLHFSKSLMPDYSSVVLVSTRSANDSRHQILEADVTPFMRPTHGTSIATGAFVERISDMIVVSASSDGLDTVTFEGPGGRWKVKVGDGKPTRVDHCLAEQAPKHCLLSFNRPLMISVIVCNAIKLACFIATLLLSDFKPLITVGDAIDSFLRRPDPHTAGLGPISCVDVRQGKWSRKKGTGDNGLRRSVKSSSGYWSADTYRWYLSMSGAQWTAMSISSITLIGITMALAIYFSPGGGTTFASWGIGFSDDLRTVASSAIGGINTIAASAIVSNLPQLLVSAIYLLDNSMLTAMTLTHELATFAMTRQSLRVSRPRGSQRSTYWLELPYRYIMPFLASMAVLHWLISESVHLVQIADYDADRTLIDKPELGMYGVGSSPAALIAALLVTAMVFLVIIGLSCRKYPTHMPVLSSNSAAISAACHGHQKRAETSDNNPALDEEAAADMAVKPLQYGVLLERRGPRMRERDEPRLVGFSADSVEPLEDGEAYTS